MSEQVLIDRINRTAGTQSRGALDEPTVIKYAGMISEGVEFDPVELTYDGTWYYPKNGFHRIEAHSVAGRTVINAVVTQGTLEDAQWDSYNANSKNGLPRSQADTRRAIAAALKHPRGKGMSDRVIADHVHCSKNTVAVVRAELVAGGQIDHLTEVRGADGKSYRAGKPAALAPMGDQFRQFIHGAWVLVDKSSDIGLIIDLDNPRYEGRVCVKRPNGSGFMTHWIAKDQLTCPMPREKFPADFHQSKIFRWNNALKRAHEISYRHSHRPIWGWFAYAQGNWDHVLMDELINAGMIEVIDHATKTERVRMTEAGCEWLGVPAIEYASEAAIEPSQEPSDRKIKILERLYEVQGCFGSWVYLETLKPVFMDVNPNEMREFESAGLVSSNGNTWRISPIGCALIGRENQSRPPANQIVGFSSESPASENSELQRDVLALLYDLQEERSGWIGQTLININGTEAALLEAQRINKLQRRTPSGDVMTWYQITPAGCYDLQRPALPVASEPPAGEYPSASAKADKATLLVRMNERLIDMRDLLREMKPLDDDLHAQLYMSYEVFRARVIQAMGVDVPLEQLA